jgi:hypothetical protein
VIDLTSQIIAFVAALPSWSVEDSQRILEALSRGLELPVDWDEDAGEAWGRLVAANGIAALVSMAGPLVLVVNDLADEAAQSVGNAVAIVSVVAMDEPVFTCDATIMAAAFGKRVGAPTLDAAGFSIEELWFATV